MRLFVILVAMLMSCGGEEIRNKTCEEHIVAYYAVENCVMYFVATGEPIPFEVALNACNNTQKKVLKRDESCKENFQEWLNCVPTKCEDDGTGTYVADKCEDEFFAWFHGC